MTIYRMAFADKLMMFYYYQGSFRYKLRQHTWNNESYHINCFFVRLEWHENTMLMSIFTYELLVNKSIDPTVIVISVVGITTT